MIELINALRSGEQCDEDGVRCIVSRQACVEAADTLERLAGLLSGAGISGEDVCLGMKSYSAEAGRTSAEFKRVNSRPLVVAITQVANAVINDPGGEVVE